MSHRILLRHLAGDEDLSEIVHESRSIHDTGASLSPIIVRTIDSCTSVTKMAEFRSQFVMHLNDTDERIVALRLIVPAHCAK